MEGTKNEASDYKKYFILKRGCKMASKSNLKQSAPSSGVNIELSEKLVTQLVRVYGVKTFCLCPGGRNAPLISVISGTKGLEVFSFFEERSAGFFAYGSLSEKSKSQRCRHHFRYGRG